MVSKSAIDYALRSDFEGMLLRKYRVNGLSDAQIRQRLERGSRFLKYVSGNKWKNVITIDKAWVYLTHFRGRHCIYYKSRGERTGESWTKIGKGLTLKA
jgi:hypothetical protein